MKVKKFSEIQKNFTKIANEIYQSHNPVLIADGSDKPMVMMSLEDFNGYEETFYLAKSPANYKRLMNSIKNVKAGKYTHHKITQNEKDLF